MGNSGPKRRRQVLSRSNMAAISKRTESLKNRFHDSVRFAWLPQIRKLSFPAIVFIFLGSLNQPSRQYPLSSYCLPHGQFRPSLAILVH